MSCCPPDSLPYLKSDTSNSGECKQIESVEFYEVGGGSTSSGKAVLILSDVWGWDSGRVRALADHFSKELDALVVIPKLLSEPAFEGGTSGDALPPDFDMPGRRVEFVEWMKTSHPFSKQEPNLQSLVTYLDSKCSKMYVIGICWGAYCAYKLGGIESLRSKCVAMATPHPSVGAAEGLFGEETLDVVKANPIPALFLPAGNDSDDYRDPGGTILMNAAKGSEVCDFPAMKHGFFTRGNADDDAVAKDVQKAVEAIVAFFLKF